MKVKIQLLSSICILLGALSVLAAPDLYVNVTDNGLGLESATNRTVIISSASAPRGQSGGITLTDKWRKTTDVAGGFWISNIVQGVYFVDVLKPSFASYPAERTTFYLLITNTTGVVYARDAVVANPGNTYPPDSVAWGAHASDRRYLLRSEAGSIGGGVTNFVGATELATVDTNGNSFTVNVSTGAVVNAVVASGGITNNRTGGFTNNGTIKTPAGFDGPGERITDIPYSGLSPTAQATIAANAATSANTVFNNRVGDSNDYNGSFTGNLSGGSSNLAWNAVAPADRAALSNQFNTTATNAALTTLPPYHIERFGATRLSLDNTAAIQACIDAASTNADRSKRVIVGSPGVFLCNPSSAVYPGITSEAHPNVILVRSNDLTFKMNGAIFQLSAEPSGIVNFFGSGGAAGSDGRTWGTTNIVLQDCDFDASGYTVEITQVFFPENWLVENVEVRNTDTYDGFDFQGEGTNVVFKNIRAINCGGNGFGMTFSKSIDGGIVKDCGRVGGNGSALQFAQNPPPKLSNIQIINCGTVLAPNSYLDLTDSYIWTTNLNATTNILVTSGTAVKLKNVRVETPEASNANAPLIGLLGGTLEIDGFRYVGAQHGIIMHGGNLIAKNLYIKQLNVQRTLAISGGTSLVLEDSYLDGGGQRDFRLETDGIVNARIMNNNFAGPGGIIIDNFAARNIFKNNNVSGEFYINNGALIENNTIGSIKAEGFGARTPTFRGNVITNSYTRDNSNVPIFLEGNIWLNPGSSTTAELQESRLTAVAVTATTTVTQWTNTLGYDVIFSWSGGTIEGVGVNGVQVSGLGNNSHSLVYGDRIAISNSVTTGEFLSYRRK